MISNFFSQLKTAFILLIALSILTGIIYPLIVTGFAQLLFPWRANGSLLTQNGKIIGSELIGQSFTDSKYFWSRPSVTQPFPYNAFYSAGSNLGPSNLKLLAQVKERILQLRQTSLNTGLVPVDLVTASGSGLDPEISPFAAFYQIKRIAAVRQISEKDIYLLIKKQIKPRTFRILGEPRINVLLLNLALDNLTTQSSLAYPNKEKL